jgi:flavin-dependent dehydrogenase
MLEERHAIMNPFGHGFHLDRAAFDELLRRSVKECRSQSGGFDVVKGRFQSIEKDSANNWVIHADVDEEPRVFLTKWVIDATGRKASLATKVGAMTITSEPLLAFYAIFNTQASDPPDNDHRTMIEATPDGWFYSALLSRDPCTRVVVFHTLPTHPSAKTVRRRDGFLDVLHASTSHISDIIQKNDYQMSSGRFPCCTAAGSSHLDPPCGAEDRWIAVGDSAMAFDPLSSQGMMTALEMGYYVGEVLAGQVSGEKQAEDSCSEIADMYRRIRESYEKHRAYYYGIVKRFPGEEFWNKVTQKK